MRRMQNHRKGSRALFILRMRWVGFALAFCLFLCAAYSVGRYFETSSYEQTRGENPGNIGQIPTVVYKEQTYRLKSNQTAMLVMGIDRSENSEVYGARSGGQADFLLLLVMDHKNKVIRPLQIDRDTIADVTTLGILGNPTGTRKMQICLSHGYGDGGEESCGYTVEAVENLLLGIEVDSYVAIELNAIGRLNDALGGVTVTVEDDFTALDSAMSPGATITLNGQQAEYFVRSRMAIGDGTNESRMRRQRVYLSSAIDCMKTQISENSQFLEGFLDETENGITTNLTRGKMINEGNRAYQYDILPVETLAGEYRLGEDGFVEFHADQQALETWVLQTFYEPKN